MILAETFVFRKLRATHTVEIMSGFPCTPILKVFGSEPMLGPKPKPQHGTANQNPPKHFAVRVYLRSRFLLRVVLEVGLSSCSRVFIEPSSIAVPVLPVSEEAAVLRALDVKKHVR